MFQGQCTHMSSNEHVTTRTNTFFMPMIFYTMIYAPQQDVIDLQHYFHLNDLKLITANYILNLTTLLLSINGMP